MKFFVVPDSSERWQTVMFAAGSLTPGLSFAIAGSFQVLILPRKMSAIVGAVELQARLDALDVVGDGHGAEHRRDVHRLALRLAAVISSSVIAASVAPKSTVPAVNCAMPPPEPMPW